MVECRPIVLIGTILLALLTAGKAQHLPQAPQSSFTPTAPELKTAAQAMTEGQWGKAVRLINPILDRSPAHLEARYYRAIARRERAKLRTLRAKTSDQWEKGIKDFEHIIKQDSSYRDVLYQYALYSQVQKRLVEFRGLDKNVSFQDAVRLTEAQLRHRPGASEHLFHLFTFYRRYVHHTPLEEALPQLTNRRSDYSRFFAGEALRLDGQLAAADTAFSALLNQADTLPRAPILLALARVHYALNKPAAAQQFVEKAIAEIEQPIDAAFVFEDVKYIIDTNELDEYRSLQTPQAYKHFFQRFWAQRNPMPARPLNVRMGEHYQRLLKAEKDYWFDGLRLWRNNPDNAGELSFPAAYRLNHEFNDKGLVYIRHGAPADRVVTVEGEINTFRSTTGVLPKELSFRSSWLPNESWRYTYQEMDFHFVIGEGATGNNWRLTPTVTNFHMLEDRTLWGSPYARMAQTAREIMDEQNSLVGAASNNQRSETGDFSSLSDFTTGRSRMSDNSQQSVEQGFSTDRHVWPDNTESFEIPFVIAAFRGPNSKTRVEIHYALSADPLQQKVHAQDSLTVETGHAWHTAAWQPVYQDTATYQLLPSANTADPAVYSFSASLPPDSYRVALHGRTVAANLLGGYKFDYRVPDFSRPSFAISDVLLARSIDSLASPENSLKIAVNPSGRFSVNQPVFVYFELYHLTFNKDDKTQYTVEYTLTREKSQRGFLGRLFGGSSTVISLESPQSGTQTSSTEHVEIDVSEIDPGLYTLTVTVTDQPTGQSVSRSQEIELFE